VPEGQRGRWREQRLEGRHDDPRLRAWSSSTTGFRRFLKEWEYIVSQAQRTGANKDALLRDDLVKAWQRVKIIEINGYRSLTDAPERHAQRRPARCL
jgi:hypothetical protein